MKVKLKLPFIRNKIDHLPTVNQVFGNPSMDDRRKKHILNKILGWWWWPKWKSTKNSEKDRSEPSSYGASKNNFKILSSVSCRDALPLETNLILLEVIKMVRSLGNLGLFLTISVLVHVFSGRMVIKNVWQSIFWKRTQLSALAKQKALANAKKAPKTEKFESKSWILFLFHAFSWNKNSPNLTPNKSGAPTRDLKHI